jgi:hypothetical protein
MNRVVKKSSTITGELNRLLLVRRSVVIDSPWTPRGTLTLPLTLTLTLSEKGEGRRVGSLLHVSLHAFMCDPDKILIWSLSVILILSLFYPFLILI